MAMQRNWKLNNHGLNSKYIEATLIRISDIWMPQLYKHFGQDKIYQMIQINALLLQIYGCHTYPDTSALHQSAWITKVSGYKYGLTVLLNIIIIWFIRLILTFHHHVLTANYGRQHLGYKRFFRVQYFWHRENRPSVFVSCAGIAIEKVSLCETCYICLSDCNALKRQNLNINLIITYICRA